MRIINLLPKSRQKELYFESILGGLWTLVVFSFLSFAAVFLVQFATKFYLEFEATSIKGQIKDLQVQVNKQENSDVKAQVKAANDLVSDYQNLVASSPKWSKLIKAFAPLSPSGLRINSFTVEPSTKTVHISGVSPTRELVIALYNNILQDKVDFSNIDYPLENIVQETNITFHFSFNYSDKLIQ